MFLFGVLLWRAEHVWAAIRRFWKIAAIASIAGFVVVAGIELRYPGDTPVIGGARMLWEVARIFQGWGAIVALIGIADRYWNRDAPIRPILVEAVFPFYIIHQTIIVLIGWWLLPAALPNWAAFLILLAATVVGCWLFYRIGRAIPVLRPLIGLSYRDRLKPSAPSPANSSPGYARR